MNKKETSPIKNIQISDNDLVGNKFNGFDLHLYLREQGINSNHLVIDKKSTDKSTFVFPKNKNWDNHKTLIAKSEDFYNVQTTLSPLSYDLMYDELFLESDIVHYHLLQNIGLSVESLPLLSKLKPMVWSLHDPWALSGHCTYSFDCEKWKTGCGDCPELDIPVSMKVDNTALNFEIKRQAVQNSDLTVLVASKWTEEKVKQSPIFKGKKIYHVPYGVNQNIFKPKDKIQAKKELGINKDSITLMFRSDRNPYKGLDIIKKALAKIKSEKKITLITVGKTNLLKEFKNKFNIIEYGWTNNDKELAKLYQACDIFLMPSSQEAFGMMAIEAMATSRMVLSTQGTALPDVINSPECGIATTHEAEAFTRELQRLIDNPKEVEERSLKSIDFVTKNYSHEIHVKRILEIYKEVIENHKLTDESKYVLKQLKKHMQKQSAINNHQKAKTGLSNCINKAISEILGKFFFK